MNLDVYLTALTRQLADAAALGGDEMVELAERLAVPLQSTARLVLQDALADAMQEVTLELAPGSAELRLRGREISFVVTRPTGPGGGEFQPAQPAEPAEPAGTGLPAEPGDSGEAGTARISFRPPDRLKAQIEAAAEREGLSVNAFLVRTLTAALRPAAPTTAPPRNGGRALGGQRLEGWVQ
ncbi:histidine kinase [Intrasporangium sp.]|uniref:histidine kinase n=1 Tax=Intrasporangium sp. TaxID=1925024 RepID=UPI002939725C|nr:histidine kinase [Intrasporangium sp.]MDV3220246.1 histidine kinase [Intrasporangium sp.]